MPTHFQGSKRETTALNAYINLMRASDTVIGRMAADMERQGLTLGQFAVMEALLHLGPMCQRDLGEKLLRSGGNVTLVIDNLEKQGWAKRERIEGDRRKLLVRLTPEGRRLIEKVFAIHVKAVVKEFGRLTAAEQEELRRLCRKLGRGNGESD